MSRKSRIRKDYRKKHFPELDKKYSVPKTGATANTTNYCIELDKLIKSMDIIILTESKKQIAADSRSSKKSTIQKKEYLQMLRDIRATRGKEFISSNCVSKIENAKLLETKEIISGELKIYEADVLEASSKESKNLLLIGGAVLLAALAIIIKVSTKGKK